MLSSHLKLARRLAAEVKSYLESLQFTLHSGPSQRIAMEKQNVSVAALLQAAWVLPLSVYTGLDEVRFGYIVADRDAPVEGVDAAVGAFINTLICRLRIDGNMPVVDHPRATRDDYMKGSAYQHVSIANLMHSLHSSSNRAKFNSLVSVVHHWDYGNPPCTQLKLDKLETYDPYGFRRHHDRHPVTRRRSCSAKLLDRCFIVGLC